MPVGGPLPKAEAKPKETGACPQTQDDGDVRLEFKRPWSDGTTSIDLEPLALIARLAALVPPPRRHITRYSGVLSSHSSLRSQIVPAAPEPPAEKEEDKPSRPLSHYISWSDLLRKTFQIDITCPRCQSPLRLIALIKTPEVLPNFFARRATSGMWSRTRARVALSVRAVAADA
jgi:hypothetical protein